MAVAVDVDPQRRDPVEITVAVSVDQVAALAALDDQRIVLHPPPHGRERMPDVGLVERRQPPGALLGRRLCAHGALSTGMSFRGALAGSDLLPSAATMKRPSPGPPPATSIPSDSRRAISSSAERPSVVR